MATGSPRTRRDVHCLSRPSIREWSLHPLRGARGACRRQCFLPPRALPRRLRLVPRRAQLPSATELNSRGTAFAATRTPTRSGLAAKPRWSWRLHPVPWLFFLPLILSLAPLPSRLPVQSAARQSSTSRSLLCSSKQILLRSLLANTECSPCTPAAPPPKSGSKPAISRPTSRNSAAGTRYVSQRRVELKILCDSKSL